MQFIRTTAFALSCLLALPVFAAEYPWQKKPVPDPSNRPTQSVPKPDQPLSNIPACETLVSDANYRALASELSKLAQDRRVSEALRKYDLTISNVSWQDTGRSHYSSGGDNISDVRLVAIAKNRLGEVETFSQPIVRLNNYQDITVDVDMSQVFVPVGNAWGAQLFAVPLQDILEDLPNFLSWREPISGSLYSPERDRQVLVSAQASLLPVPVNGEASFVPSIFNYQSTAQHPAVLVILVSNRGTSVTVIDNKRDSVNAGIMRGHGGGQMLFHNANGEKAPFVARSFKEVSSTAAGQSRIDELTNSGQKIAGQQGVNQVMMIQVPLIYPQARFRGLLSASSDALELHSAGPVSFGASQTRGLDTAVVDVAGYTLGPFVELAGRGLKLVRNPKLPIRIDVIRHMATDTSLLTGEELAMLPEELRGVYAAGQNIGSLVTGDDFTRITRNYRPWQQTWWNSVVWPYFPNPWQQDPALFLKRIYGPYWMYRFATEELAVRTMREAAAQGLLR